MRSNIQVGLVEAATGVIHLPNGMEVRPWMSKAVLQAEFEAAGYEARHATLGWASVPGGQLWWSFHDDQGFIRAAQMYLLPPDMNYVSRGPIELRRKAYHDRLLIESLGEPHERLPIKIGWFWKLGMKGSLDFAESTERLDWHLDWGEASSFYDIREYEPLMFVNWSRPAATIQS